jgi:hypothetical protein
MSSLHQNRDYVRDLTRLYPRDDSLPDVSVVAIQLNSRVYENPGIDIVLERKEIRIRLTLSKSIAKMTMEDSRFLLEWIDTVPHILKEAHLDYPHVRHAIRVECMKIVDAVEECIECEHMTQRRLGRSGPKFIVSPNSDIPTPVIGVPGSGISSMAGLPGHVTVVHGKRPSDWDYKDVCTYYRWIAVLPEELRKVGINDEKLAWAIANDAFTLVQGRQAVLLEDPSRNDADLHTYP